MMMFSPAVSFMMNAWPVGASAVRATPETSTPASWRTPSAVSPAASSPTVAMSRTVAAGSDPLSSANLAAATAWFAPLPPSAWLPPSDSAPGVAMTVSPAVGKASTRTKVSMLTVPQTRTTGPVDISCSAR